MKNEQIIMEESIEETFRVRSYSWKELALLYNPSVCPTSAMKTLRRWIREHPQLSVELAAAGWRPHKRLLTPRQVRLIAEYLGEP